MKRSRCVISLRTQVVNLGDYLILVSSILFLLEKYEVVVLDTRGTSGDFVKAVSGFLHDRVGKERILIKTVSLVELISTPFDYYGKPGGYAVAVGWKRTSKSLFAALVNKYRDRLGLGRSYYLPISISGSIGFIEKIFFNSYSHVLVRDPPSYAKLRKAMIKNCSISYDMSHYLLHNKSGASKAERDGNGKSDGSCVVSFRFDRFPAVETITRVVDGGQLKLNKVITQVMYDKEISDYYARKFGVENVLISINRQGLITASEVYSDCHYVISNRLHVLLLGLLNGAVPVPLVFANDNKVSDYMSYIGFSCLDADDVFNKSRVSEVLKFNQCHSEKLCLDREIASSLDRVFN